MTFRVPVLLRKVCRERQMAVLLKVPSVLVLVLVLVPVPVPVYQRVCQTRADCPIQSQRLEPLVSYYSATGRLRHSAASLLVSAGDNGRIRCFIQRPVSISADSNPPKRLSLSTSNSSLCQPLPVRLACAASPSVPAPAKDPQYGLLVEVRTRREP